MKGKDLPRLGGGATQDGIVYSRHGTSFDGSAPNIIQSDCCSNFLTVNPSLRPPPPPPPPPSGGVTPCHPLLQSMADWHGSEALLSDASCSGTSGSLCLHPQQSSRTSNSSAHKKTQYHKTKLCPWHRDGKCFMGSACNYAHSREELKPKPDLSKTKLCPEVVKNKRCDRPGCRFAHDFVELRATSTFFKTRICKYWQRGYCPAGEECRHAHGKEDLRQETTSTGGTVSITTSSEEDLSSIDNESLNLMRRADEKVWSEGLPPPASAIPSPSFLSTTASTPLKQCDYNRPDNYGGNEWSTMKVNARDASAGAGCANREEDEDANASIVYALLRNLVASNDEWTCKHQGHDSTPLQDYTAPPSTTTQSPATPSSGFDERQFLPSNVLQSLSAISPMNRDALKEMMTSSMSPSSSAAAAAAVGCCLQEWSNGGGTCKDVGSMASLNSVAAAIAISNTTTTAPSSPSAPSPMDNPFAKVGLTDISSYSSH